MMVLLIWRVGKKVETTTRRDHYSEEADLATGFHECQHV
jgi:hypothetical protein